MKEIVSRQRKNQATEGIRTLIPGTNLLIMSFVPTDTSSIDICPKHIAKKQLFVKRETCPALDSHVLVAGVVLNNLPSWIPVFDLSEATCRWAGCLRTCSRRAIFTSGKAKPKGTFFSSQVAELAPLIAKSDWKPEDHWTTAIQEQILPRLTTKLFHFLPVFLHL